MPVARDLSDLPSGSTQEGRPPRRPRVVTKLAEVWAANFGNENAEHAIPEAGPYRGSWASKRCDRQLQYGLDKTPKSNPPDLAGIYRMNIGTMVHEKFQQYMEEAMGGGWESERVVDLNLVGIPGSMRVDGVQNVTIDDDERVVPVELKTINGFGFKTHATNFKGPPKGPRSGHELQLAYAVVALDAPYGILGYLSLETISPSIFESMHLEHPAEAFAAEWTVSRQFADLIVEREAKRIDRVLRFTKSEAGPITRMLHDEEYPAGATVIDPSRGAWVVKVDGQVTQTGKTWMCGYCDYRDQCVSDGDGWTQVSLADDEPF